MFENDIMGNGQPLAGALADILGCKEGVKDPGDNLFWYTSAGVADTKFNRIFARPFPSFA